MTSAQSKSVLIVEPHPGYRKLLHFFAAQAGHQVQAVEGWEQARQWLHSRCVDAVLCAYPDQSDTSHDPEKIPTPGHPPRIEKTWPKHPTEPARLSELATNPSWDTLTSVTSVTSVTQAAAVIWVSSISLPENVLGELRLAGHGVLAKPLDPCAVSAALDQALFPDPLEPLSATLAQFKRGMAQHATRKDSFGNAQDAPSGHPHTAPPQHITALSRLRVLH